jgi:mitogen-activated protein kinase organizer 1
MKALFHQDITEDSAPRKSSFLLPQVPVARLSGHDGPVQAITFTSNGKYCLTAGHDRSVRLWNPTRVDPEYVERQSISRKKRTKTTLSSLNSKQQSIPDNGEREFQDLPPSLEIQKYTSGFAYDVSALTTTSSSSQQQQDDLLLAASNKTCIIFDLLTAQQKRQVGSSHHSGRINAVAAFDSQVFLTASFDTTVALWDGRAHQNRRPIQVLKDAKDSVTNVQLVVAGGGTNDSTSLSASSNTLIRTASVDGCVRTYDLRKGTLSCDDFMSPITGMAATKDGQCLVVSCLDGTIRLMELDTGELLNTYHGHHTAGNYGLQVDVLANDATIITGSEDGSCVLYDLVTAKQVQNLQGPARPTCTVVSHPNQSSVVIAASYDNSTVVWAGEDTKWQQQLLSENEGDN